MSGIPLACDGDDAPPSPSASPSSEVAAPLLRGGGAELAPPAPLVATPLVAPLGVPRLSRLSRDVELASRNGENVHSCALRVASICSAACQSAIAYHAEKAPARAMRHDEGRNAGGLVVGGSQRSLSSARRNADYGRLEKHGGLCQVPEIDGARGAVSLNANS